MKKNEKNKKEQLLKQEEIDALLKQDENNSNSNLINNNQDVKLFDFAKDRIVRGKMPTLEMINEKFIRSFNVNLINYLKEEVNIEIDEIEIIRHEEYITKLERPTSINIVKINPFNGKSLFVFNARLIYMLIDCLFGGTGKENNKRLVKNFSNIENKITQNILETIFEDLKEAWSCVLDVNFEYESTEVNPKMINIISPSEMMVINKFKINILNNTGFFHIAVPFSHFEPVKDLLHSGMQSDRGVDDERWKMLFHEEIYQAKVKINALLGTKNINLNELSKLKEGDIIPFDMNKNALVSASSVPIFWAKFGKFCDKYSLKIVKPLSIEEYQVRTK